MNTLETKIRLLLIENIDEVLNNPILGDFDCYFGENQSERMADAALSVLLATKEAQDLIKRMRLNYVK